VWKGHIVYRIDETFFILHSTPETWLNDMDVIYSSFLPLT
jgi:hypothetical protein